MEEVDKSIQDCLNRTTSFLKLKNEIRGKEVTILLGQTKCGKSALANYLLGEKLRSVRDEMGYTYELEMLETFQGPQIKDGVLSGTSISTVYTTPDGGILIDSPGFDDNRGIHQDIFNCLCIHQIRFAKSVKFVLLCYIGDLLSHNVQNFTKLLKQMTDLVPNIEEINKSWCIIFTKDKDNITPKMLRTKIKNKILLENDFKTDKKLLHTLIANENSIGIFKTPTREGVVVFEELDDNVKNAIDACDYVPVKKLRINFALGQDSINYLRKIQEYYKIYFKFQFGLVTNRIIKDHINYFAIDEYVYAAYGKELKELQGVLDILSENLTSIQESPIENLEKLKFTLEALLDVKKLRLYPEFESHLQFMISLNNASLIDKTCQIDAIWNYQESIKKCLEMIQMLSRKITAEHETRKAEGISDTYEEVTFAPSTSFAVSTTGGFRASLASLTGFVGLTVSWLSAAAESSALATAGATATVAATSAVCVGTIIIGGIFFYISSGAKDSLNKRYNIRCRQHRC